MRTLLYTLLFVSFNLCVSAQTNDELVVNTVSSAVPVDDQSSDQLVCQNAFDQGLILGGTIAAVLYGLYLVRKIPGGGAEEL